jgi:hypothetical protein
MAPSEGARKNFNEMSGACSEISRQGSIPIFKENLKKFLTSRTVGGNDVASIVAIAAVVV